jgi:CDP-glycerol glycerophosphotransferase (TagB/SpsB family)/O-antigen/teichoic acid export membrane protein
MTDTRRSTGSTEHLKVVARGGVTNLMGAIIGAVGQVGLVLIIARQLDASNAGEFFALNSAFLVITALSSLGTESGLGRFLLRYEVLGRREDIGEALRVTYLPVLTTATFFGAVMFVLADPIVQMMGVVDPTGATALRVLAVGAPLACLSDLFFASTRAFGQIGPTVAYDRIMRSLAQPALVWLTTLQTHRLDMIAAAWVAPYALSVVAGLTTLRKSLRERDLRPGWRRTERTKAVRVEFWSFTWARGMTQVAQLVIQRADIVLIAALRSPSEAAIYTAATRFVPLGQMATISFQQVLQPRFTMVIAEKDDDSLRQLFQTGTMWNILVAWPVYCLVGAAPVLYLSVFGEKYGESGVWVVVAMAFAMLLGVGCGPLDTVIIMLGRSRTSLANILVAVVVDIGLCLLLIPVMGIVGAALAWLASSVVRAALGLIQVRRLTRVTPLSSGSLLAGALSLGLVGAPVLVGTLVGLGTYAELGLCLVAGLLYLAAVLAMRERFQLVGLDLLGREGRGVVIPEPHNPGPRPRKRSGSSAPTAVFESWRGQYSDSPGRLSELMAQRLPEVRRFWSADDTTELPDGVHRLRRNSPAYFHKLATADLLVANDIMTRRMLPGPRTLYVQTWHGTPLKLLGYDERTHAYDVEGKHWPKVQRDIKRWDYLVSPSPACTQLLRSAFRYDGPVLEVGYPRNDMLLALDADIRRKKVRDLLGAGQRKVVLYMPTWRDDWSSIWDDPEVVHLVDNLPEDTVLWVRGHRNERQLAPRPRVCDVSSHPEVGELYLAADILMTDYSSAVFDFAVTRKPMVLFAPDLKSYEAQRGLYFDYEEWAPGPVARTAGEALEAISGSVVDRSRYDSFVATFCPYEDGQSGVRVMQFLNERLRLERS